MACLSLEDEIMCDCKMPATPNFARPVTTTLTYSPPASWDPIYDPDKYEVGGMPLLLVCDDFKHRNDLLTPPTRIGSQEEFQQLFAYKETERDRKCGVICEQQQLASMAKIFNDVIDSTGKSSTRLLIGSVESDMLQVVLFQKKLANFNRARPYQIRPDLAPPFTPGHPSYPGGHAAQSHAMASVIALILQRSDNAYASQIKLSQDLAADLAINREIAGIHYPSDTAAGLRLAELYLAEAMQSHAFAGALGEARQEWT
jgi:hypothetical protein